MADTPRTNAALVALLSDGAAAHSTNRQLLRDWLISVKPLQFRIKQYLGAGTTTAQIATAITAAVADAGAAGGGEVVFDHGLTFASDPVTVASANVTFNIPEGTTLQFPVVGTGIAGITVTANNFAVIGKGRILGPNAGTYVLDERGISMIGTSSASRKAGLVVNGTEITGFGGHGVYAQFVDRIRIPDAYIHHCGYAGAMFLSCDHGRIGNRVRIETITPGTSSNMYGISLTHDSTNYSSDGNAGTQQAANPFCANWVVDGAYINDINWEGIDCHGGYDISIINCKVYNTKNGIALPGGSGAAVLYAGWKNRVAGCTIDGRTPTGGVSGRENTGYAINVNGGATVQNTNVIVSDNIITAKGTISQSATGVINAQQLRGGAVHHNTFRLWGGVGVLLNGSDNTEVTDNIFQEIASGDTVGRCVVYTGTTGQFSIRGNQATANGATPPLVGFAGTTMTVRPVLSDNDFKVCSTAEALFATSPAEVRGTDWPCVVRMTAAAAAVDVTPAANGTEVVINVIVGTGGFTLDTITGAKSGQVITIINTGASTVTFSRSSSALLGSATAVIPTKGTLRLVRIGTTNYEISRSLTNG